MSLQEDSYQYIKKNSKNLIQKFASLEKYPSVKNPFTHFMAGSPGAGKTEFSISLIKLINTTSPETEIVRIDPDEVRKEIPGYTGKNTSEVQRACVVCAENIFNSVLKHSQNFIYDGTLSSYRSGQRDINKCLKKQRNVGIFYIYQDPVVAWRFTKIREAKEGRPVPKDFFIKSYFDSWNNVNKFKRDYKAKVRVSLIIKDYSQKVEKFVINVDKIESFLKNEYNPDTLAKMLPDKI